MRIEGGLSLRAAAESDEPFLRRTFGLVRQFPGLPASDAARLADMQFDFQRRQYRAAYPDAETLIVEQAAVAVGYLILARQPSCFRILDLNVLPESQGRGIGSGVVGAVLGLAREAGVPVELSVFHDNPARGLYERAGFEVVDADGLYIRMRSPVPSDGEIVVE